MPVTPSPVSARYLLELDGQQCGFVESASGGSVAAGAPRPEPVALTLGFDLTQRVYDWIASSWSTNAQRMNGSIVTADFDLQAQTELQFVDALITEVGFPALDAGSKDPAYMSVKFSPEYTRWSKGSGKVTAPLQPTKQKRWLPSNFRFELDGLPCGRVGRIDAFTVGPGSTLPPRVAFPNLSVTISEADAPAWIQWHEGFAIKGAAAVKGGALVFLAPDLRSELGRIALSRVGILGLQSRPVTTGEVATFTVELDCGQMHLQVGRPMVPHPTPTPIPLGR